MFTNYVANVFIDISVKQNNFQCICRSTIILYMTIRFGKHTCCLFWASPPNMRIYLQYRDVNPKEWNLSQSDHALSIQGARHLQNNTLSVSSQKEMVRLPALPCSLCCFPTPTESGLCFLSPLYPRFLNPPWFTRHALARWGFLFHASLRVHVR